MHSIVLVSVVLAALLAPCLAQVQLVSAGAYGVRNNCTFPLPGVPSMSCLTPGSTATLFVVVKNTGSTTWAAGSLSMVPVSQGCALPPCWNSALWGDFVFPVSSASDVAPNSNLNVSIALDVPSVPGLHGMVWSLRVSNVAVGTVNLNVEVTCSDGNFCNGVERLVDGSCVSGSAPCDDSDACTTDTCDNVEQVCNHVLDRTISGCNISTAECNTFGCVPQCSGFSCGDDGCGGLCGTCPSGQGCLNGICASLTGRQGTCLSPIPITANPVAANMVYRVNGDTSTGIHLNKPSCNPEALAPELIYKFRVPANARFGVDIRVGNVSAELDTILELRKENCTPPEEAYANQYGTIVGCADDSTPPGAFGSRVEALVYGGPNGTDYFVLVSGYCQTCVGPFELVLHVTDGCVPTCDGKFCGASLFCPTSSYGCGQCPQGEECTANQRCRPVNCVPDCTNGQGGNKTCGDDGCGGSCGSCIEGVEHCDVKTSTCHTLPTCNSLHPICTGCTAEQYCGSDCMCYNLTQPIPDLTIIQSDLLDMSDEWTYFDNVSCASVEGCVGGTGWRRLLRFTVSALNQGYKDLAPGNPEDVPDLFEFSPCHAHFHFEDFARYYLLNPSNGGIALTGRKQAYCMLDSHRKFDGVASPCLSQYACDNQGVSVGWVDTYSRSLDCQWLDITGVPIGQYDLYVVLNPRRIFHESSWENNAATVRVTIAASSPPPEPGAPVSAGNPSPVPKAAPVSAPANAQVGAPKAKAPGSTNSASANGIAFFVVAVVAMLIALFN